MQPVVTIFMNNHRPEYLKSHVGEADNPGPGSDKTRGAEEPVYQGPKQQESFIKKYKLDAFDGPRGRNWGGAPLAVSPRRFSRGSHTTASNLDEDVTQSRTSSISRTTKKRKHFEEHDETPVQRKPALRPAKEVTTASSSSWEVVKSSKECKRKFLSGEFPARQKLPNKGNREDMLDHITRWDFSDDDSAGLRQKKQAYW